MTTIELPQPKGESRIWLPAVFTRNAPYQRTLSNRFTAGGTARLTEDKQHALGIVSATYPVVTKPRLTLANHVLLKNYSVDHRLAQLRDPFLTPSSIIFFGPADRPSKF